MSKSLVSCFFDSRCSTGGTLHCRQENQTYRYQTTSIHRCTACMRCGLFVHEIQFHLESVNSTRSQYTDRKRHCLSQAGTGTEFIILYNNNELVVLTAKSRTTTCAARTPPMSLGKRPSKKTLGNR